MTRVTDFRNTWCEATEENYNKLVLTLDNKIVFSRYSEVFIIERDLSWAKWNKIHLKDNVFKDYRQIKLIDNDFYYVDEEKEENSFNKFGFETPEFEGEILKVVNGGYIGVIKDIVPVKWNYNGKCLDFGVTSPEEYNLTPIKKPWYENEDNIGKLLIKKNTNLFFCFIGVEDNCPITIDLRNGVECTFKNHEDLRPSTKEEVLKLVADED